MSARRQLRDPAFSLPKRSSQLFITPALIFSFPRQLFMRLDRDSIRPIFGRKLAKQTLRFPFFFPFENIIECARIDSPVDVTAIRLDGAGCWRLSGTRLVSGFVRPTRKPLSRPSSTRLLSSVTYDLLRPYPVFSSNRGDTLAFISYRSN